MSFEKNTKRAAMTLRGKMRKERGKQPEHAEHEEKAKS